MSIDTQATDFLDTLIAGIQARVNEKEHSKDDPIVEFPKKTGIEIRAGETRIGKPEGMSPEKLVRVTTEYIEAQKQTIRTVRQIKGRIEDVQVAVSAICEKQWGTTGKGIPFMGQPPMFDDVVVGVSDTGRAITKRVIVSEFSLEPLEATIEYGGWRHEQYGICGMISVVSTKGNEVQVTAFLDAVESYVENHSIYKGKVVEFRRKKNPDQHGDYELSHRHVRKDHSIVYNKQTEGDLLYGITGNIRYAKVFSEQKDSKAEFNTLLYGPYGTGKTECTIASAVEATKAGWTTIFFTPSSNDTIADLEAARNMAGLYAPSLLVVEDIDRYFINTTPQQDAHITSVIGGMTSKGSQVSMVMTTNFVERLPMSMTRPGGRTDMAVEIGYLDREATERLFRTLLADELDDGVDFDAVYEMVEGTGPSFVRSTFERARKNSIITNNGEVGHALKTEDFVYSARAMREQAKIHNNASQKTLAERVVDNIKEKNELMSLLMS